MERRGFLKTFFALPFIQLFFHFLDRKEESKKVLLLDTVIAGFSYYDGEAIWNDLSAGDMLLLKREPGNDHDERAVEVYHRNGKLGYIPRVDNSVISQLMDRNEKIKAEISWLKKDPDPWERIGIKVYMEV